MQLLYQVKATDGQYNSTDPISWQEYTGSQGDLTGIAEKTLMDVNIPNVNSTNERYYPFKTGKNTSHKIYLFKEADNTWVETSLNGGDSSLPILETTEGMKIVCIPSGSAMQIYIAKNNTEYLLIPNIATTMRTETYVASNINASNIDSYRQWGVKGSVYTGPYIPLNFHYIYFYSTSNRSLYGIGVKKVTIDTQVTCRLALFSLDPGSQTYSETENGSLPVIATNYYSASSAPSPTQNLDSRVTLLESEVSDLKAAVAELQKQIKNIPELIAWTNEAVSKHYVAR